MVGKYARKFRYLVGLKSNSQKTKKVEFLKHFILILFGTKRTPTHEF